MGKLPLNKTVLASAFAAAALAACGGSETLKARLKLLRLLVRKWNATASHWPVKMTARLARAHRARAHQRWIIRAMPGHWFLKAHANQQQLQAGAQAAWLNLIAICPTHKGHKDLEVIFSTPVLCAGVDVFVEIRDARPYAASPKSL